jgi:hypothetical protein
MSHSAHDRPSRWSFSLRTLFVVVTLAALLAGESRREREAARKAAVHNSLRQMSIAVLTYHQIRALPPKSQTE